jgi:integrase
MVHPDAGTRGLVAPKAERPPEPEAIEAALTEAVLTEAGRAALAEAAALARNANAPATLRAYRSDWAHYAGWCAAMGFVPVPAEPSVVGAYLASLTDKAPTTVRRRLAALAKMHRFNDLQWNPAHRDIRGPLDGLLRRQGRPVAKAAPLTLDILRQLLATCDVSARGRRDRALLLFGFAGALRRSELVALRVEDVVEVAGGLKLRIRRGKTDQAGQGAEIGLPRGRHVETCPVRAFHARQEVAKRKAGPLFRRISTGDRIGDAALHPDAVCRVLAHRVAMAGVTVAGFETLSAHSLRGGSSLRPMARASAMRTSCAIPAIAISAPCAATCSGPASSPRVPLERLISDGVPDALGPDAGSGPAAPDSSVTAETTGPPADHSPNRIGRGGVALALSPLDDQRACRGGDILCRSGVGIGHRPVAARGRAPRGGHLRLRCKLSL